MEELRLIMKRGQPGHPELWDTWSKDAGISKEEKRIKDQECSLVVERLPCTYEAVGLTASMGKKKRSKMHRN